MLMSYHGKSQELNGGLHQAHQGNHLFIAFSRSIIYSMHVYLVDTWKAVIIVVFKAGIEVHVREGIDIIL